MRAKTLYVAWHDKVAKTLFLCLIDARPFIPSGGGGRKLGVDEPKFFARCSGLQKPVYALDFDPKTGILATGGADNDIKVRSKAASK